MSSRIEEIIEEIEALKKELKEEVDEKKKEFLYTVHDHTVKFEQEYIERNKERLTNSLKYLSTFPFGAVLTIPFIWGMVIPAFVTDVFVSIYQTVCFPIYKIPKVKRSDYIIVDRYNLFYLNRVEKVNCLYCEYFNGLTAYVREIAARTEQYWCPIKHSRHQKEDHSRYDKFFEYGDAKKYSESLKKIRGDFKDLTN